MSKPSSDDQWARLAGAARRAGHTAVPEKEPDGEQIRARFQSMTETIRQMFLLILWKRWALLAVILCLLAYAAVYLALGRGDSSPSDQPAISLPVPP